MNGLQNLSKQLDNCTTDELKTLMKHPLVMESIAECKELCTPEMAKEKARKILTEAKEPFTEEDLEGAADILCMLHNVLNN